MLRSEVYPAPAATYLVLNVELVLDDGGKAALQKYLNNGGNFVAVHSASDSLVNTTFYGREVGMSLSHGHTWAHS